MIKKYLVLPGFVTSRNDGDRHFIDARKLMMLYKVNPEECVIRPDITRHEHRAWKEPEGLIHLYPRYDGNYNLPEKENEPC